MAEIDTENNLLHQGGRDYLPLGPVPIGFWGKDHWSLLAYIETRVVDYDGKLHNPHLRCNPDIHPAFAHGTGANRADAAMTTYTDGDESPTRLRSDCVLWMHDDWSCIEDFAAHGFIEIESIDEVRPRNHMNGYGQATVTLTEPGIELVEKIRRHKTRGGTFATFTPPGELPNGDDEVHEETLLLLRSEEPFRET